MNYYRLVNTTTAAIAVALGALTLVGWTSGFEILASLRRDYIPMAPSTGIGFAALGAVLLLHRETRLRRRLVMTVTALVAAFSAITLAEFLFEVEVAIESRLIATPEMFGPVPKGRMSPITALNFLLIAAAIAGFHWPRTRCLSVKLAAIPVLISFVVLLGYLHGTPLLYGAGVTPVALPTAAGFILLGVSTVTRAGPMFWPLKLFVGSSTQATLLRWFLPTVVGLAVLIGILRTKLLTERLLNPALTSTVSTLIFVFIVSALIVKVAERIGERIDRAEAERNYAQAELELLNLELEERVAARTLELRTKNQQIEEELTMARELQLALLPQYFPTVPRTAPPPESALQFFSFYYPTGTVSGDFFSVFPVSESSVGVFICDVMGHGVRAALVTSMMRALLEQNIGEETDPGELLTQINRGLAAILKNTGTTLYATAVVMIADVEKAELRYANAGHPKPIHVHRKEGAVSQLPGPARRGMALGIFAEAAYHTAVAPIAPGDLIMLFTDGLFEVAGEDEELYSEEALLEAVSRRTALPAEALMEEIMREVRDFADRETFEDDVCVIGIEVTHLEATVRNFAESVMGASQAEPAHLPR